MPPPKQRRASMVGVSNRARRDRKRRRLASQSATQLPALDTARGVWKIEDRGEKNETENRARGLPIPGGQRGRGGGRMGGRGIRGGAKQERWAGAKVRRKVGELKAKSQMVNMVQPADWFEVRVGDDGWLIENEDEKNYSANDETELEVDVSVDGVKDPGKSSVIEGKMVDILVKSEPDDEKYKQGIPTHKSTHPLSEVKLEKKECGRVNKSPAEGLFCTECHQKLKPGHVAHRRRGKQEIYCSSSCLASHIASSKLPANQLPSPLPPQHPVVPPSSASHLHNPHQSTVEEAVSTSIPCSVCGKNTPARHEVTYQNETFQLCSDKCLTRFGSQHQTPATENQRENKATRSVCHYCMGSASPQYFLNMSNGTRYAVCSTDCLSAFQLLLSQGVLPVPLPPLSEISPPAPPSAPVVLKCVQCRESFSHIPDLLEWKGTVLQFCGRACVRIWARNVTAVCDQCRRSKPVACRAHFPGLSCTFCSDTCRWLHQAAFSRKLGKGAGTCTHCLQLCSRSSAQSSSVSRLCFCSNICQKSYTLCYIKAYPCDRCHVTCAPEAFLPWGGAVRRFCNHACLMLYCFDQAGGGLLGNIVTSSSGEEKPTDIFDKLDAGTSLGSSNLTISFEEHSTSHGFTKSNHNASAFAVGEVQVEDHSKNQTLGTSQAKQRASRREQVAWSVGEGDVSRAAGRTDVEVALRAWLRGSLGRKHRIDASQLLSKAQRLSFEMAAAFTPTHPWLRGFVAREGISLGDTERDVEDTLGEDGDGENNANVNSHPSPVDGVKISRIPFPVPVPIYVPVPMHMYCQPTPSPVALPIPIPIPLLIPSSKASEQRKVHSEAEQAQEKGEEEHFNLGQGGLSALPAKRENSKSKRKSEIIAASVVASPASLESRSRLSHSVASPSSSVCPNTYLDPEVEILNSIGSESKAKLSLGHKAWKLWADGSLRPKKGQPSVFLSLSQSERASALYAFASEAQRPNGQDYRPDCLYYLCLGLQRYLSEAGIEDDIFSDSIWGGG
uniref:HTH CENPB-type domain-containing protein n=1 Tax=Eptatretus burgeri TaxID=7764 RepID=A0A8C4QVV3_EPTBU